MPSPNSTLAIRANVGGVTDQVLDHFMRYDWPGNVRELRNVLEACFITVRTPRIGAQDLPPYFRNRCEGRGPPGSPGNAIS